MVGETASLPGAVIDASALAAIIFREPGAERVAAAILSYDLSVTTSLLEFEVYNVALVKARRGEVTYDDAERALGSAVFPLVCPVHLGRALSLAHDLGLTAYDAAYLELARELDIALITLDRELVRAAPERCLSPL